VSFGRSAPPPYLTWPEIQTKYLSGGDASRPVTNAVVTGGLRQDSTATTPTVAPVFGLRFETTMPSAAWRLASDSTDRPPGVRAPAFVTAVPAGGRLKPLRGVLVVAVSRVVGGQLVPLGGADLAGLVATGRAASFPTSLWSVTPADPQHDHPPLA